MTFFSRAWHFPLILALALAALFATEAPEMEGDVVEYAVTTIAIASHGSADIRLEDLARARQMLPRLKEPYDLLEAGMRANSDKLYAAFTRGREGKVFAIHFWGYPALAAGPFKVLDALGQDPFKAFQVVNLAAVFILGLALRRLFGSAPRALLGVGLFMLCGGSLYMNWSSPECLSAAALLAGLALYTSGAPLAGAVMAGLAGQQNPTILFFFGFAPLLHLVLDCDAARCIGANIARVLQRRYLLGLAAGMAVFALPPLFNLYQFGVPNIIAKLFSDPSMIGRARLHSFFFDLNQGMVLGIPGLVLALVAWGWRKPVRDAAVVGWAVMFTLTLAIPALAVLNWNSGAAGIMRYAFWAAMPLLFVFFLRMARSPAWPAPMLLAVVLLQGVAMQAAASYRYVDMSPLAQWVMKHAPQLYHPEPEIFVERLGHHDNYIEPERIYVRGDGGVAVQTLYNSKLADAERRLCGLEGTLGADNAMVPSARFWRYIDGPVRCTSHGVLQQSFQYEQFAAQAGATLGAGWANTEANGGGWNGAWSDGARSRLTLRPIPGSAPASILIRGYYFDGNAHTRVRINGADLGWQDLSTPTRLPLAASAQAAIEIELEHEAPRRPTGADPRAMAFFIHEITLR